VSENQDIAILNLNRDQFLLFLQLLHFSAAQSSCIQIVKFLDPVQVVFHSEGFENENYSAKLVFDTQLKFLARCGDNHRISAKIFVIQEV
jgi:hypothetical protein